MINRFGLLMLAGAASLCGCSADWRPSIHAVRKASGSCPFDFTTYLETSRLGYWVYERTEVGAPEGREPVIYRRHCEVDRFSEGGLADRPFLPLEGYLRGPDADESDSAGTNSSPEPPMGYRAAFLMELADATEAYPLDLQPDLPSVETTQVRYYWRDGRLLGEGELTRTVRVEGFEDVECPAGRFEQCLRLRFDLTVRFPVGFAFEWTAYIWLAREVGEVRRIQSTTGWFLIIPFHSAHEFLLKAYARPRGMPETNPAPRWKYGAMEFDRGVPKPRMSGMMIDYHRDE